MSNFPFIDNEVLKKNLDIALDHITYLLIISESQTYIDSNKSKIVSSLRKTIIIHTASIIEAMLLWKLKKIISDNSIELDEWQYKNCKVIYKINESEEAIGAVRVKINRKISSLDFNRLIDYSFKYKIITTKKFLNDLHKVRKLRNQLHIGGLEQMEKEYTKEELEFCFDAASRVKNRIKKMPNNI